MPYIIMIPLEFILEQLNFFFTNAETVPLHAFSDYSARDIYHFSKKIFGKAQLKID